MGGGVSSNSAITKESNKPITNSNYSAHTTPLFIELSLLKVQDITIEILL